MIQAIILSIVFTFSILSLGIVTYLYFIEKNKNKRIIESLEKIDIKPIQDKIDNLIKEENRYFSKIFEMEMYLENYRKATLIIGEKVEKLEKKFEDLEKLPKDYEMTYRDVVRKILEMDNKFTDRFNMLTQAILEIGKNKNKAKSYSK